MKTTQKYPKKLAVIDCGEEFQKHPCNHKVRLDKGYNRIKDNMKYVFKFILYSDLYQIYSY